MASDPDRRSIGRGVFRLAPNSTGTFVAEGEFDEAWTYVI
jgi:hypothetical protein